MKLLPLAVSTVLSLSVLTAGFAEAGDKHKFRHMDKQIVKINSDDSDGLTVMVVKDGDKKKYSFTADELENMDNVEAKMGDLDQETLEQVVMLVEQINNSDASIIEIKDASFGSGEEKSQIFLVKSSEGDKKVHVEVDIEGDHAAFIGEGFPPPPPRVEVFAKGDGPHKGLHKRMKWVSKDGEKPEMNKVIEHMINRADLTREQIEQLQQQLNDKLADL
jgi:hypothetical protein